MQKENENTRPESYGKFATAEELLAAYNALESEFTKRCQLLKQLQAAAQAQSAQAQPPEAAGDDICSDGAPDRVKEYAQGDIAADAAEQADGQTSSIGGIGEECTDDAGSIAQELSDIPEVMEACIAKYKKKLLGARTNAASIAGLAVIMPAKRPRTLKDAKALADRLINNT